EVAAQLRLRRESGEPREVGGNFLIQKMETRQFIERQPPRWIVLQPVELLLEFRPRRTLSGDEARQVNNHRSCRAFTLRYCETSCAVIFSLSSKVVCTPRRCKIFPSSRSLCHRKWPPSCV